MRQCTSSCGDGCPFPFSKLPVRQCTLCLCFKIIMFLSKLPVRQCTQETRRSASRRAFLSCLYGSAPSRALQHPACPISKLPVRQCTVATMKKKPCRVSKLPVRQCTGIISSHNHDFHTKKAKNLYLTLFFTHSKLSFKINLLQER